MKKIILITLTVFSFFNQIYSQDNFSKPVAKVGNINISGDEFLERYEMTPGFNRQRKNSTESNKIEFLFTLVAEKLWALEAINRNLDTSGVVKFATKEFEKMFVRDALFKREIQDKIIISDQELDRYLGKYLTKLYVKYLFSDDVNEINSLYNLILTGVPFDSILTERPENNEQVKPEEIVFGQMDEGIEDVLYSLNIGENTKPILTPDGWYIFKLVNKSSELMSGENDRLDNLKKVKKIVEARRLIEKQKEFYEEFFQNKKVDIEPKIFEVLAQEISSVFKEKKKTFAIDENELINFDVNDFNKIKSDIGNKILSEVFLKIPESPVTTNDYLKKLLFDGFSAKDYKINYIRALLDQRVRRDIEKEMLYLEGLKRGYQNLPEVRKDVEMWKEHYLCDLIKDQFRDSINVTDSEVYNYYKQRTETDTYPMLVNIVEVLTDSLEIAVDVLNKANLGADMKMLAKKYNKREWTKKKDGEYGLFPVSQYGEIGKIASTLDIGEVYGPLKLKEGYSVFKLIDKQEEKTIPAKPFARFKDEYKQELIFDKLYKRMSDFTYSLAVKYGIQLELNNLEDIKVTTLPSFGIRYLGFGGKITAVPLMTPNSDWADKWIKNQQQIVP